MASFLNKFGFIKWFSDQVVTLVAGLGLQWQASFAVITLLYFYSHYLFASGAAHIGAMYTAFLSVSVVGPQQMFESLLPLPGRVPAESNRPSHSRHRPCI